MEDNDKLINLLENIHSTIASHIETKKNTDDFEKKEFDQLFDIKTEAVDLVENAIHIVQTIRTDAKDWRLRKISITKKVQRLYIAIASIGQARTHQEDTNNLTWMTKKRYNDKNVDNQRPSGQSVPSLSLTVTKERSNVIHFTNCCLPRILGASPTTTDQAITAVYAAATQQQNPSNNSADVSTAARTSVYLLLVDKLQLLLMETVETLSQFNGSVGMSLCWRHLSSYTILSFSSPFSSNACMHRYLVGDHSVA